MWREYEDCSLHQDKVQVKAGHGQNELRVADLKRCSAQSHPAPFAEQTERAKCVVGTFWGNVQLCVIFPAILMLKLWKITDYYVKLSAYKLLYLVFIHRVLILFSCTHIYIVFIQNKSLQAKKICLCLCVFWGEGLKMFLVTKGGHGWKRLGTTGLSNAMMIM